MQDGDREEGGKGVELITSWRSHPALISIPKKGRGTEVQKKKKTERGASKDVTKKGKTGPPVGGKRAPSSPAAKNYGPGKKRRSGVLP